MMADTLLFLMSPAKGHLNATFGLARSAVQQGDRVVYGLPSELHPYVSVVGFECVRLESFPFALNGEQILDKYTTQSRIKYLDNLLDRFYDKFYENRQKTLISVLEQIKPTIIFLDSFQSTDFIILYPELKRRKIRFAFIQTMLSLHQQADNLPLFCDIVPTPKTNFIFYWQKYYFVRYLKNIWNNLRFLGRNNQSMVKRKFYQQHIPDKYLYDYQQIHRVGFRNIPEFIVSPLGLEFCKTKLSYQYYVGSHINWERKQNYNKKIDEILDSLSSDNKLIYCSLGTIYSFVGNRKNIIHFYKQLAKVAQKLTQCVFIINLSHEYAKEIGNWPNNVHIFEEVPQLVVLKKSAIFVTHGGLNSVKEALELGIPLLAYPVDMRFEQPSNAAKIVFHGLGLKGDLKSETYSSMAKKIEKLLIEAHYKENIKVFNESLCSYFTISEIKEKTLLF